ncbi:MAG: hypothetical protein ABJO30_07470 [Hyphomicrobiales bacterium]
MPAQRHKFDENGLSTDMKRLIDEPKSDVFDVLAYVKFTLAH